MNVTIFITVLFWGDAQPVDLAFLTDSPVCSKELTREYTKPLRKMDNWKLIVSKCEVVENERMD